MNNNTMELNMKEMEQVNGGAGETFEADQNQNLGFMIPGKNEQIPGHIFGIRV